MLIKEKTEKETKIIELYFEKYRSKIAQYTKPLYTQDAEEKNFVCLYFRLEGNKLLGLDLGYHSEKQMYDIQEKCDCCYTKQGFCYYDGSSLNAQDILAKTPIDKNFYENLFKELKDYYEWRFLKWN